jgi:RNA polymerase sigma-70 factor, ECF subfamily
MRKQIVTEGRDARCKGVEPGTERDLVARLKRGESAAFDAIYAHMRPRLYSFLARLSRSRDLAEELVQETFVRLASSAASLTDDTRIAAWLFTVARRLFVSHVRLVALDGDRLDRLSLEDVARPPTPFEQAAATETQRRLERALASLPEAHREALLLVAVESLEPIEAAAVIGIAPEAMRQRLARARAMLKAALEESRPRAARG